MDYKNYGLLFLFLILPLVSEINKHVEYLPHTSTEFRDNSSLRHSVTSDKSSYFEKRVKREERDYHHGKRISKSDSELATICVNPRIVHIDECFENTNPQVVEKCVPGLSLALNDNGFDEDTKGLITHHTKDTEICLRQAFGHCSFDSRYLIKTKLKKMTGVNIDLAFQDEFQMDYCDAATMNEVLNTVSECFKNLTVHVDTDKCQDVAAELLEIIGHCVEDHTAYSCILQNHELFRDTMDKLIEILKQQVLKHIKKMNKANKSKLCILWISSSRLLPCEPIFFEYIEHLDAGKDTHQIYGRLFSCYKEALNKCSAKTVRILIKILVGAIDGKPIPEESETIHGHDIIHSQDSVVVPSEDSEEYEDGKEYPVERVTQYLSDEEESRKLITIFVPDNIEHHDRIVVPNKIAENCDRNVFTSWMERIKSCSAAENVGDVNRYLPIITKCVKKVTYPDCSLHVFSRFHHVIKLAIKLITELIKKPLSEKDLVCFKIIKDNQNAVCDIRFFIYFMSMHHAHHTKESLVRQLEKMKLCYITLWKQCRYDVIQGILEIFAAFFKIPISRITPPKIIFRVTYPKGHMWCETRMISGDMAVPSTKVMSWKPPKRVYTRILTPTTRQVHIFTPSRRRFTEIRPKPTTKVEIITPKEKIFTRRRTPSTTEIVRFPLKTKTFIITHPTPRTEIFVWKLTRTIATKVITPTTIEFITERLIPKRFTKIIIPPVTRIVTRTPVPRPPRIIVKTPTTMITKIITFPQFILTKKVKTPPTKILGFIHPSKRYFKIITPTTILRRRFTPTPKLKIAGFTLGTKVFTWKPKIKTMIQRKTSPSTATYVYSIIPKTRIDTRRPPKTRIVVFIPKERIKTKILTPTTIKIRKWTVPSFTEVFFKPETSVREHIIFPTPFFKIHRRTARTKEFIFTPTEKFYKRTKVCTTIATRKVRPTPKIITFIRRKPTPLIVTRIPQTQIYILKKTPTTTEKLRYTFTVPHIFRTKTQAPTKIIIKRPTPRLYIKRKTKSTVKYVSFKPTVAHYKLTMKPTTIKEIHPRPRPFVVTAIKRYTTKKLMCKPKPRLITEIKLPTTIRRFTLRPITKLFRLTRKVPPTIIIMRHQTKRREETLLPTTHKHFIIIPKRPVIPRLRSPPLTRICTMRPPPRIKIVLKTPSTVRTRIFTVAPKTDYRVRTMTTLKFFKWSPKIRLLVRTFEAPTTRWRIIYPTKLITEERRIIPTKKFIITPKPCTKKLTRVPGITKIIRRILPIKTRIITPTTRRGIIIPVKTKVYSMVLTMPATKIKRFTPAPRAFSRLKRPTTAKFFSWRPPIVTFEHKKLPTTIKFKEIINTVHVHIRTRTAPPTKIIVRPPTPKIITRFIPQRTTRRRIIKLTTRIVKFIRPTCLPKILNMPPPSKEYTRFKVPKTSRIIFTQPVTNVPFIVTMKPIPTRIFIFTPKVITKIQRKTKSTVKTISWPVKIKTEIISKLPTTRFHIIIPIKTVTEEKVMTPPTIVPHVFTPKVKIFTDFIKPTTVRRRIITFPTKLITDVIPFRTKIFTIPVLGRIRTKIITPTTVKDFAIPFTMIERKTKRPVTPEVIGQRPPSRFYTKKIKPTVTSIEIITPKEHRYTQIFRKPTTRKIVKTPKRVTKVVTMPFITEVLTYKPPAIEYVCVYKPKPPINICLTYKRCTDEVILKWKHDMEQCIAKEIEKKGESIWKVIQCYPKFIEYVKHCIKKIGDLHCRNKKFILFERFLENELSIVGSYSESAKNNIILESKFGLKQCFARIKEHAMDRCAPGLYKIITGILFYGKPVISLRETRRHVNYKCLEDLFSSCATLPKKEMESLIYEIFGKCVKLTKEGGCPGGRKRTNKRHAHEHFDQCSDAQVQTILQRIKNCQMALSHKHFHHVDGAISAALGCASATGDMGCRIMTWDKLNNLLCNQIKFIKSSTGSDECTEHFEIRELKPCLQPLLDNLQAIIENESVLKPIATCLRGKLHKCSNKAVENFLTLVLRDINLNAEVSLKGDYLFRTTISSIKHHSSFISVCENVYGTTSVPEDRPSLSDDCVEVCGGNSHEKPISFLVSTCTPNDVDDWLKECKDCVEKKTSSIGLRNPDYLTLPRVLMIMQKCVKASVMHCRPKHHDDFEKAIQGLLNIVVQNTFVIEPNIRDQLKIKIFSPCIPKLHRIFILTTQSETVAKNHDRALNCIKEVSKLPADDSHLLLDIFELPMVLQCSNVPLYRRLFSVCQSDDVKGIQDFVPEIDHHVATAECGPGGYLKKVVKRDVDHISLTERNQNFEVGDYDDHEKMKYVIQPRKSSSAEPLEIKQCIPSDYEKYAKELNICVKKRLQLKFSHSQDTCYWEDMTETMTGMMECLIEDDVKMLSCKISMKEQLNKFLHHVNKALKMDDVKTSEHCVQKQSCQNISLDMCSSTFYNLMKTSEENSLAKILHGFYTVKECFDSEWPTCPTNSSTMAVSIFLSALGIDYDLSVVNSTELITCAVQGPETDEKIFKECLNNHTYHNPFAICEGCARRETSICSFQSLEDMFEVVDEDIRRVRRCLKTFQINKECINDFTEQSRNRCLPIYYRFLQHLQNGRVIGIIEKIREFHKCIVDIKNYCPEEFKYFVPDFYFDVLGISQFMEKSLRKKL